MVGTPFPGLRQILAKDLNADGQLDLVMAAPIDGKVYILLNQGNRIWSAPQILPAWGGMPKFGGGGFDGDGKMDLLVAGPDKNVSLDWTMPWV